LDAWRQFVWFSGLSLEQWGRILQANGWNDVTLRDSRYNQAIHMVSHPPGGSSGADGGMAVDCLSNTATDLKRQDVVVSQVREQFDFICSNLKSRVACQSFSIIVANPEKPDSQ
jgi:hypothetical protein